MGWLSPNPTTAPGGRQFFAARDSQEVREDAPAGTPPPIPPSERMRRTRAMAIDMETATIFAAAFANRIPAGALMLVSDQSMVPEGVKTEASDRKVTDEFVKRHIKMGIEALRLIRRQGNSQTPAVRGWARRRPGCRHARNHPGGCHRPDDPRRIS